MAENEDALREQILRYRNLHALTGDPVMRRTLEQLIRAAQTRLDGVQKDENRGD